MLFTRCPDCETTFRVTDEALKVADGQVRCGRCANVFNAYAELHDPAAQAPKAADSTPGAVANIVAQIERGVAELAATAGDLDGDPPVGADTPINPQEVDEVLAAPAASGVWPQLGAEQESPRGRHWWSAAASLGLVALGAQAAHHFRADLAGDTTIGPWIRGAYASIGVELAPSWNIEQYAILDWVATAEPNARGLGSLKITAHIQNRGPQRQPYPAVHLRLKDRWEEAVGSRMFAPAEYLSSDTPRGRLMSPGETARAEIEVIDPGPDAYGFELDVCIEGEAPLITCGTDKVFL